MDNNQKFLVVENPVFVLREQDKFGDFDTHLPAHFGISPERSVELDELVDEARKEIAGVGPEAAGKILDYIFQRVEDTGEALFLMFEIGMQTGRMEAQIRSNPLTNRLFEMYMQTR